MLFSQFQTWGEGRKGFIFFSPINKNQNFFVDVDEDDTWKMKKKLCCEEAPSNEQKTISVFNNSEAFFVTNKGEQKWATREERKVQCSSLFQKDAAHWWKD